MLSIGGDQDRFGYSVALSGDGLTAMIGATQATYYNPLYFTGESGTSQGDRMGRVYIYTRPDKLSGWSYVQTLSGVYYSCTFGWSIALSYDGSAAIIGTAYGSNGITGGYVYFYNKISGVWTRSVIFGATYSCNLGYSVSINDAGTIAAASLPGAGIVYIYQFSAGNWSNIAELTNSSATYGDFGYRIALSSDGSVLLIGYVGFGGYKGAACIYNRPGSTWSNMSTPTATLSNSGGVAWDMFGCSVGLSNDGSIALIGANGAPYNSGSGPGRAYIYSRPGSTWSNMSTPTATLSNSGGLNGDNLGTSVALNGDGSVAMLGSDTGKVYIFTKSATGWSTSNNPDKIWLGSASNNFGYSVALDDANSVALIGAPSGISSVGSVSVYL
jgi:hypothetical protein